MCQRCGTPFSYVLSEEEQEAIHQQATTPVGAPPASSQANPQPVHNAASSAAGSATPASSGRRVGGGARVAPSANVPHVAPPVVPPRRKGGCMRNCFVIFLVILTIVVFSVRTCLSERSYTIDSVQDEADQMPEDESALLLSPGGDVRVNPGSTLSEDGEKAPRWLQGNWAVTTPHGSITMTIKNKIVVETSNGQTSHGSFVYKRGRIICDFGDGEEHIRRVDEGKRLIDAGDGAWMHKTEFSD